MTKIVASAGALVPGVRGGGRLLQAVSASTNAAAAIGPPNQWIVLTMFTPG